MVGVGGSGPAVLRTVTRGVAHRLRVCYRYTITLPSKFIVKQLGRGGGKLRLHFNLRRNSMDHSRALRRAVYVAALFCVGLAFGAITVDHPAVASTACDYQCEATTGGSGEWSCQFTGNIAPWACVDGGPGECVMVPCDPKIE